jgi:dephospho-CoA kinase
MMRVGITGGIGAGKTTVCRIFESLDIPVYYADDRAKDIMTKDNEIVKKIKTLLGNQVYQEDGSLNRQEISRMIFRNPALRNQLNTIVHPAVGRDVGRWFDQLEKKGHVPYALEEAALLVESGAWKALHALIVVTCPMEARIERVMRRDDLPREAVEARLASQLTDEERARHADYVIQNDGNKSLVRQVLKIHARLTQP